MLVHVTKEVEKLKAIILYDLKNEPNNQARYWKNPFIYGAQKDVEMLQFFRCKRK
jgi:hypothetical protein